MSDNMDVLAANISESIKKEWSDVSSLRGISGLIKCIPHVVVFIEKVAANMAGQDKKKLAIAILLKLCPLPRWLSWIPGNIVQEIIGAAIDAIVEVVKNRIKK